MKKLITILAALAVTTMFATAAEGDKKPAGDTGKPSAEGAAKPDAPKGEKKPVDKEAQFKKLDTDADGKLSLDELKAGPMGKKAPDKIEGLIKAKDKDADGKLSLDEYKAEGGKKKKDK